jgi:hypothetical protein
VEFNYAYTGDTVVESSSSATDVSFAPDTLRQPTFFSGELEKKIEFREAISALHDVVISDLRWKPKDKTEYKAWLAKQELVDWAEVAAQEKELSGKIKVLRDELDELRKRSADRMKDFYKARQRYFRYLYLRDRDAWIVLDPVISVHPDEVFFECFSQDESSYGRLSVGYEVFKNIQDFSYGTTNIDYSGALYDEFQKIRTYKTTKFEIDPSGFQVQTTSEERYKEVKIDLPNSWIRGFLQVNSAMALPSVSFDLHPMDIHNLCMVLRRNKEIFGPRAMRFHLKPDHPVRVVFEPWEKEVVCPRSIFKGGQEEEIRTWGRRRIHILERLIPIANRFTVFLLGKGMPTFYVADLGNMAFTLGLSGWTANDWSKSGNFDLLAPRADVDQMTQEQVFRELKKDWRESPDSLSQRLNLDRAVVMGALSAYTQAGRAIWDLNKQVYRARELSREPLPMHALRFTNEREQSANRFLEKQAVKVTAKPGSGGAFELSGTVKHNQQTYTPSMQIDGDERIIKAKCSCNWHQQNQLRKGPCEHILALRLKHGRQTLGKRFGLFKR